MHLVDQFFEKHKVVDIDQSAVNEPILPLHIKVINR